MEVVGKQGKGSALATNYTLMQWEHKGTGGVQATTAANGTRYLGLEDL